MKLGSVVCGALAAVAGVASLGAGIVFLDAMERDAKRIEDNQEKNYYCSKIYPQFLKSIYSFKSTYKSDHVMDRRNCEVNAQDYFISTSNPKKYNDCMSIVHDSDLQHRKAVIELYKRREVESINQFGEIIQCR